MLYDKWIQLTIHADDKTSDQYTRGVICGYKLVKLANGDTYSTDKLGKYGTFVRGILKRKTYGTIFYIKEGSVANAGDQTGEYTLIGINKILHTYTTANYRNFERGQDLADGMLTQTTQVRDQTHQAFNNCSVVGINNQVTDTIGVPVFTYIATSTQVYDGGARKQLFLDYAELPAAGQIVPVTFMPGFSTIVDCDVKVVAPSPTIPTYEKVGY